MKFAIRQQVLYKLPDLNSTVVGYISSGDTLILLEETVNNFSKVFWFNKTGYVNSSLISDYYDVFNKSVWVQSGSEVTQAELVGRASQYIYLTRLGLNRINYNLCGEFCVAQLLEMDIIDVLKEWKLKVPTASSILSNDRGTSLYDLNVLLSIWNRSGTTVSLSTNNPPTPLGVKTYLPAIVGVGIDSYGRIKTKGTIRHWVVLYDILPQANTGWCLVYNPYWNRAEAVLFNELLDSYGRLSLLSNIGEV